MKFLSAQSRCWCGSGKKYSRCHQPTDVAPESRIQEGVVGPKRPVPDSIVKPDYSPRAVRNRAQSGLGSPERLTKIRKACVMAREVLDLLGQKVSPGLTTDDLDLIAHEEIISRGAYPSTLGYLGYPKSMCTSVNEVICHGIPDDRELQSGDIVNCDVTVFLNGVHGDCSATFAVGPSDHETQKLIEGTHECLLAGVNAVKPGRKINEIGKAIERTATGHGLGVVRAFTGHGIGEAFHMDPQVPHYFEPRATEVMRTGMTFTIEPMITLGTYRHLLWENEWTAVTADGRRTAQFEHTVAVTDSGAEILTAPRNYLS